MGPWVLTCTAITRETEKESPYFCQVSPEREGDSEGEIEEENPHSNYKATHHIPLTVMTEARLL